MSLLSKITCYEGDLIGCTGKYALVVGRFNSFVVESLVEGAVDTLLRHGIPVEDMEIYRVPGAYKILLRCRRPRKQGKYDAIIVWGIDSWKGPPF